MGLSSSQARLLTLTNRQHAIELNAQRIHSDKLRLANDSERVYQNYINALDETQLMTKRSDESGKTAWVNGSINNLMRYGTDGLSSGTTFYVQDLATGKLYVPKALGEAYDAVAGGGAIEFAKSFGINYSEIDLDGDIRIDYEAALNNGYNVLAGRTGDEAKALYLEWYAAQERDIGIRNYAAYTQASLDGSDGVWKTSGATATPGSFTYRLQELQESSYYQENDEIYTQLEKDLLNATQDILTLLTNMLTRSQVESVISIPDSFDVEDLVSYADGIFNGLPPVNYDSGSSRGEHDMLTLLSRDYTGQIIAQNDDGVYINEDYFGSGTIDPNLIFMMILNGGTINFKGQYTDRIFDGWDTGLFGHHSKEINPDPVEYESGEFDIYGIMVNTSLYGEISFGELLNHYKEEMEGQADINNLGQALNAMFKKVKNLAYYEDKWLQANGITKEQMNNYIEFQTLEADYNNLPDPPRLAYNPDNKASAAYYEEIYNAIEAAGGWIEANETRSKSDSWVNNMIKSNQVILAVWDDESGMLSKTANELHYNIREIANQNKIEDASAQYEADMAAINAKDKKYDTKLSQLETERSAITQEMDSLKTIMRENVNRTFKVFT